MLDFQPDLRNLRAAGILPVFAAGNCGPTARHGPSPANNPEAFAVGGTDDADAIDPVQQPRPLGLRGGDLADARRSRHESGPTDLYGGYMDDTGTSLAAPHVTGALALLLRPFPAWPPPRTSSRPRSRAAPSTSASPGVDDDTGFGRLDALAAYLRPAASPTSASGWPASAGHDPGRQVSYDVSVTAVGNFAGDVSLSTTGLPAGAVAALDPATVTGGSGTARLTVSTDGSLAPGTYPFTVVGTSGSLTHSVGATLVVSPPPDFSIAVTPASRTVEPGGRHVVRRDRRLAVRVRRRRRPQRERSSRECGVGPAEPRERAGVGVLDVDGDHAAHGAGWQLPAHDHRDVRGEEPHGVRDPRGPEAGLRHHGPPDDGVGLPRRIRHRHRVRDGTGGFTGAVSLAVSGVPSSTYVTWSSTKVTVPGTSKLAVRTTVFTTRRSYTLTITGTSGTLKHSVPVTLKVT